MDSAYRNRQRGRAGTGGRATRGGANSPRWTLTHRDVSEEPCLLVATLLVAVTGAFCVARAYRDRICWSVIGAPATRSLNDRERVICLTGGLT